MEVWFLTIASIGDHVWVSLLTLFKPSTEPPALSYKFFKANCSARLIKCFPIYLRESHESVELVSSKDQFKGFKAGVRMNLREMLEEK